MHQVVAATALCAFLVAVPVAHAGTAASPDITDPAGDVLYEDPVPPPHPCVPAVDLLSLWVEWTAEGAAFHYTFDDLAPVEDHPEQDLAGRCFYSYTDFVLQRADGTEFVDALYVDHWANPAFATGWRFYLHEAGDEAVGTVDVAAGTIDVVVPMAALGNPGPGDVLGSFQVQSTTQFVSGPAVADFATDMSPDGGPCACPVPFPTSSDDQVDAEATAPEQPSASASQSATNPPPSATATSSASAGPVRTADPGEPVTSTSSARADPVTDEQESNALGIPLLVLALVALVVRSRLR